MLRWIIGKIALYLYRRSLRYEDSLDRFQEKLSRYSQIAERWRDEELAFRSSLRDYLPKTHLEDILLSLEVKEDD